jgi:predicted dehydrogenase
MVADTHLHAIADLPASVRLYGVHSRNPQSMERFAAHAETVCNYPVHRFSSISEICNDTSLDFAIVLTPPNARLDIVQSLASAHIDILMEKPIERTTENARAIVEMCTRAGIVSGVVFQHRVSAASIQAAKLVREGSLGGLCLVKVDVPWWRAQSYYDEPGRGTYERDGGGVLISQAIHTLDLMLSLTGPVTEVQAMCRSSSLHQMESEDFVTAGLSFENGAYGSLMATTASFPGAAESIELHCENAVAVLHRGMLTVNWRDGRVETTGEDTSTGGGADPMAFTSDWHRDIIADFASCVASRHEPVATVDQALRVHALIDALVESSRLSQTVSVR